MESRARVSGLRDLPGKTKPRASIICGRQPPSQRPQQRTLSREPSTRYRPRRQRRSRCRWPVHAQLHLSNTQTHATIDKVATGSATAILLA
jgi:hypothetical protein